MRSPFVGMDPYIEACGLWPDFHDDLIGEIRRALAATAPDRYLIRTGERSYVVLVEEGKKVFTVEAKISYLNPGNAEIFYARGGVIKPGKRFHFCEAEIYYLKDGEEVIVAKGSATMAVV